MEKSNIKNSPYLNLSKTFFTTELNIKNFANEKNESKLINIFSNKSKNKDLRQSTIKKNDTKFFKNSEVFSNKKIQSLKYEKSKNLNKNYPDYISHSKSPTISKSKTCLNQLDQNLNNTINLNNDIMKKAQISPIEKFNEEILKLKNKNFMNFRNKRIENFNEDSLLKSSNSLLSTKLISHFQDKQKKNLNYNKNKIMFNNTLNNFNNFNSKFSYSPTKKRNNKDEFIKKKINKSNDLNKINFNPFRGMFFENSNNYDNKNFIDYEAIKQNNTNENNINMNLSNISSNLKTNERVYIDEEISSSNEIKQNLLENISSMDNSNKIIIQKLDLKNKNNLNNYLENSSGNKEKDNFTKKNTIIEANRKFSILDIQSSDNLHNIQELISKVIFYKF